MSNTLHTIAIPLLVGGIFLAFGTGCREPNRDAVSIPRQYAYPRLMIYPAEYSAVEGSNVHFEVNNSARCTLTTEGKGNQWLTISYPSYGVTVHATITTAPDHGRLTAMTENRLERISLNTGGVTTTQTELTTPTGFAVKLFTTPGIPTPVQFIATGGQTLVSGAMILDNTQAVRRIDSIAPIISAVEADMLHALRNLDISKEK